MVRFVVRAAVAAATALCALAVQAQAWPAKPVHLIVPFPPGGSVDPLARMLGARLADSLGQQFIIENKTGASGSIGTAFVAKSAPDGYTYAVVFDTHAVNQSLIPNLPYDTLKDFAPVMLVGTAPLAIVTSPSKPYKTIDDVIRAAKARPEALSIGSVGNGSIGHLSVIVVQQLGGFKVTHVPYKGGGPMMADVMGSQIELGIASTAALSANVKAGKLRALAITGDKRSHVMPDVPTLAEEGFPASPRSTGGVSSRRRARPSRSSPDSTASWLRRSTSPTCASSSPKRSGWTSRSAPPRRCRISYRARSSAGARW